MSDTILSTTRDRVMTQVKEAQASYKSLQTLIVNNLEDLDWPTMGQYWMARWTAHTWASVRSDISKGEDTLFTLEAARKTIADSILHGNYDRRTSDPAEDAVRHNERLAAIQFIRTADEIIQKDSEGRHT